MPTDLLLPAFALTLLANAVLVALAVRGLLRARSERHRQDESNRARLAAWPAAAPAPRPLRTARPPTDGPTPPAAESPSRSTAPDADPATPPEPAPPKPATKRPRRTPSATKPPDAGPKPRSRRRSGDESPRAETRRRRFSLPDLDEDHERINRSIETFLSGSENSDEGGAIDAPTVATTVALVAIDGLATDSSVADPEAVEDVVATVERTLRDAARSADRVTPVGTGRFRVVLLATGELAARAYLRRVRATVGPSLEAADGPLGLVTATATVLDDSVPMAIARAEARLDAALASAARRAAGDEPRIAAD